MIPKENYRLLFVLFLSVFYIPVESNSAFQHSTKAKSLFRDKVNKFGYANFVKHENRYLQVNVALSGFLRHPGDCAFVCANYSNGFSFNFAVHPEIHGGHVCEILSTDKYNHSRKFIKKAGFDHYSINSSCLRSPCVRGTWCSVISYEEDEYTCNNCTGHHCENDIDECASNPCQNGATCVNRANRYNRYICRCLPGYRGANSCESEKPECVCNPCHNGGTCHAHRNRTTCSCDSDYTGQFCENES